MKKLLAVLMAGLLILSILPACAESIDLSTLSDEELIALMDEVQAAFVERKIEKTATLHYGTYTVGEEFPAGNYILAKNNTGDYGKVQIFSYDEDGNENKEYSDGWFSSEENSLYFHFEEGMKLYIEFDCTLTISNGVIFE